MRVRIKSNQVSGILNVVLAGQERRKKLQIRSSMPCSSVLVNLLYFLRIESGIVFFLNRAQVLDYILLPSGKGLPMRRSRGNF